MESARPQQTVEQLLARLEQVAAKSSRRKSALKSLMKAYDLQMYINKDYVQRLINLQSQYDVMTDGFRKLRIENAGLKTYVNYKPRRWWQF